MIEEKRNSPPSMARKEIRTEDFPVKFFAAHPLYCRFAKNAEGGSSATALIVLIAFALKV